MSPTSYRTAPPRVIEEPPSYHSDPPSQLNRRRLARFTSTSEITEVTEK